MDPVTHTLIGVGMANAFFRRRIGPEAVPILAVASLLPDVDGAVHFTGDPTAILMRRTFGHSLFMLPLWAMLFAVIVHRFYKHLSLPILFALGCLGAGVHVFFDLVNSFGVVLLWPLSNWRPELAMVFIIDLFLTGLLAAPLLLCLMPRIRPHLVWLSQVSMACLVAYLLLCGAGRTLAERALAEEMAHLGMQPDFTYIFPEPLGPHRWRGVMRQGDTYRIYLLHPFSRQAEPKGVVQTHRDDPGVQLVRQTPLAQRLEWFFKAPVWQIRSGAPVEVSVYDLRFQSLVVDQGNWFEYRFQVNSDGRVVELGR